MNVPRGISILNESKMDSDNKKGLVCAHVLNL